MAPYTYHAATVAGPTAQDAFDVKLNQTVFAAAFGIGGLIFLVALAYVSFWIVGRCTTRRSTKSDKAPPKALLLPTQVDAKNKMSTPSLVLSDSGGDLPKCHRTKFWFSRMRRDAASTVDEKNPSLHDLSESTPSAPPLAHVKTRRSHCRFEFVHFARPDMTRTRFQEPATGASVPRIIVEDLEPCADLHALHSDSVAIDHASSHTPTEKEQPSDDLLSVPPMTWNAPRDPDEIDEKDEDAGTASSTSLSVHIGKKTFEKPKNILSVLANLSHASRRRSKVASPVLDKNQAFAGPSLTRCLTRQDDMSV